MTTGVFIRARLAIFLDALRGTAIVDAIYAFAGEDANMWILGTISTSASLAELMTFRVIAFCRPITALDCRALHASKPSCHVCSRFALPAPPQLPNQEPPRAQQLRLPVFLMTPHVRHSETTGAAIPADVCTRGTIVKHAKMKHSTSHYSVHKKCMHVLSTSHLRLQAFTPSDHV